MKKGNIKALLPIAVYLVLFLGSGLITKDFYAMPAIVAFLIALLVAMIQTKGKTFDECYKNFFKNNPDGCWNDILNEEEYYLDY